MFLSEHCGKHAAYVQQLRYAPMVPHISGFTMPTMLKDAETNACFKQVLLRPHGCPGSGCCRKFDFTSEFCAPCSASGKRGMWSFCLPWRLFHAQQLSLAQTADKQLFGVASKAGSGKWPVLHDCTIPHACAVGTSQALCSLVRFAKECCRFF